MTIEEIKNKVRNEIIRIGCVESSKITGKSKQQMSNYARGIKKMSLEQSLTIGKQLGIFDIINID